MFQNNSKFCLKIEITSWICAVTGLEAPAEQGQAHFQAFLRNGHVLCSLINTLKPGVCRAPHDTSKTKLAVSTVPGLEMKKSNIYCRYVLNEQT